MPAHRVLLLAALLLAAGALPLAGTGGAVEPSCGTLFEQNDAGSGGDAPGAPAGAVAIVQKLHYGAIGHPHLADVADLEDWYFAHVLAGARDVMIQVTPYQPAGAPFPMGVEAWRPGGISPEYVGQPTPTLQGAINITFPSEDEGDWLIRVLVAAHPASAPCIIPTGPPPANAIQNYGLYFGCDPHCDTAAS